MIYEEARKLKVGDKVMLYTEKYLRKHFDNEENYIATPVWVLDNMFKALGKIQTIKEISDTESEKHLSIILEGDDLGFYFDAETIAAKVWPEVKPGDKVTLFDTDELIKMYGPDEFDDNVPKLPIDVVGGMTEFLGKTVTVEGVKSYQDYDSDIEEEGYGFYIEKDEMGFCYDMLTIKEVVTEEAEEKKEETEDMSNFAKKIMKYMTEAFERWNEPTTGEKINSIMWLVHQGYMNSDEGAEMITKIIEQEDN